MPLDSAVDMHDYQVREKNPCLGIGLPIPVIAWPKDLFADEINQGDLVAEFQTPSKSGGTTRTVMFDVPVLPYLQTAE